MVNFLHPKQLLMTAALLLASISSFAYDFEVDGIYYNKLWDENSVEVTYKEIYIPTDTYIRDIKIPSQIVYEGTTYNVTSIGDNAFDDCSSLVSISIPDRVTYIGKAAFAGCSSLVSINIPKGVTTINDYTFSGCSDLTSITIPDEVTSIGIYAFSYSGLASMIIPDGVTSIAFSAFENSNDLSSVVIGNGITSIGNSVFGYCGSLKSITIPDGITSIGKYAFVFCGNLTSVTFGKGVTLIGESSFSHCSDLKEITCKSTMPPLCGKDAFEYVSTSGCALYIPEDAIEDRTTEPWSNFKIVGGGTETPKTCEAPTIAFDNDAKKLVFTSATEGAKCRYTITCDDINTSEKEASEATMTGVYTITAYASAEGMYNSEKTTAKLCWVSAAMESDGIMSTKADRGVIVSSNAGQININGTMNGETIEVYNVGGSKLKEVKANGGNTTIVGLQSGNVYIVKIGGTKVKVAM